MNRGRVTDPQGTLKEFIDDGHVIIINVGKYGDINDPNSLSSSHSIVLFGYSYFNDSLRFIIKDPWFPYVGNSYFISYEKFVNGRNNQLDEESNQFVWTECIAIRTEYFNHTVPYFFNQ